MTAKSEENRGAWTTIQLVASQSGPCLVDCLSFGLLLASARSIRRNGHFRIRAGSACTGGAPEVLHTSHLRNSSCFYAVHSSSAGVGRCREWAHAMDVVPNKSPWSRPCAGRGLDFSPGTLESLNTYFKQITSSVLDVRGCTVKGRGWGAPWWSTESEYRTLALQLSDELQLRSSLLLAGCALKREETATSTCPAAVVSDRVHSAAC